MCGGVRIVHGHGSSRHGNYKDFLVGEGIGGYVCIMNGL